VLDEVDLVLVMVMGLVLVLVLVLVQRMMMVEVPLLCRTRHPESHSWKSEDP
jgi:hypothetical protein